MVKYISDKLLHDLFHLLYLNNFVTFQLHKSIILKFRF